MDNTDPRYIRSRLKLRAALLELAEDGLEQLSVSAVCARTGIDRATFYRHFADLDGLVEDTLTSLVGEGRNSWQAASRGTGDQLDESVSILTSYFDQVVEHWTLYRWALGPTGSARVIHSVLQETIGGVASELTLLYGQDENTAYRAWFMGGGLLGSLLHWLQTETPERSSEDLARWVLATSSAAPNLALQQGRLS
jgi:AcrR family transcriptional regulator